MKDSFYFPHDYNAIQDPKMMILLSKCGLSGVGLYWILVEILHQQPDGTIKEEEFVKFIEFYCHFQSQGISLLDSIEQELINCGLLIKENGMIKSIRVIRNKQFREGLKESGKRGADKRWGKNSPPMHTLIASSSPPYATPNAIKGKERKGKEIEKTIEIGGLILKDRFLNNLKTIYGVLNVESEILACITWYKNKGREIKSWDRAIANWLKIAYENKGVVGGEAKGGVKWNKL